MTRRRRARVASRRGILLWLALVAAVALVIVWRAHALRGAIGEEIDTNYAVTTQALLVRVVEWSQTRAAHAETMAELLGADAAAAPAGAAMDARFARAMAALARRRTFVGGRVLDPSGRVLARAGDVGAGGDAGGTADAVTAAAGPPVAAAGPRATTVHAVTVRCGGAFCVEFRAPVLRAGQPVGTVVLVASVDDSTFRPLNAVRAGIRTARASVLAPLGPADTDTFAVVASLGAVDSPEPASAIARARLPVVVRAALAAPAGRVRTGIAAGLHGAPVHYGIARVPDLGWVVVRELDRAELLATARQIMLVQAPILVLIPLAVVVLVRGRIRAARARRERELTRLRADFVASTSHELRTPLAQIRMFAELLQQGTLRRPDEAARALRIIEKEASRLTILVDNLLNYTRLRRHAERADVASLAPTHVADDVQHVLEAFAPLAAERGVRVVAEVPPDLHVRVDALALRQVLTNYLENAVKYGPPGQTVVVGASADERCVRLWVDDEGEGVPAHERAMVWEAFSRGDRAERTAQGGSGIGLAVVRELALQYGGDVALEDAPGGGARFVAEFPRARDVSATVRPDRPGGPDRPDSPAPDA